MQYGDLVLSNNLKELELKGVYRSGKDNLLSDFYIPALKTAKYYDRAVGFFSTSLISYALKGISAIVKNDGSMRLIIGHPLDSEEFDALKEGDKLQSLNLSSVLSAELDKIIESPLNNLEKSRLRFFTLLVATGRLEIKFACKLKGMYHEKIGIIKDSNKNKILFHGSANETTNAMNPDLNYESIAIYKSWLPEMYSEYAQVFEIGFEDLWNGNDPNVHTMPMPSELYEKMVKHYKDNIDVVEPDDEATLEEKLFIARKNYYPEIPLTINDRDFKLFEHQTLALRSWFASGCVGLFKLATGSGKTITAMYGVAKIFQAATRPRKMLLIVAVPYQILADQWVRELSLFNMKPIKCYESRKNWEERLSNSITLLKSGELEFLSLVVVNKTLNTPRFLSIISRVDKECVFFVGDECHRHANENVIKILPAAKFKMGLSATPYLDAKDEDGIPNMEKEYLNGYYGDIVAKYELAEALSQGILAPYKYYIVPVVLTYEETALYIKYSKDIGRQMAIDNSKENKALSDAIRKRTKVISNTEEKHRALDSVLKKNEFIDKSHTLFYVGEGTNNVDDENELSDEEKQISVISKVVMNNGWQLSKFTSLESKNERIRIMKSFEDGAIDSLVSMRVLDEGIDIPECKRAFILASSTNPRQFIQRRGRILRKSKGKDFAEIFDFVVVPSQDYEESKYIGQLVRRELARVMDFVRLSFNRTENEATATDIANKYNIDVRDIS